MKLTTPCHFRSNGMFCWGGYLHYSVEPHNPVLTADDGGLSGSRTTCPACDGKAVIPTEDGKKILQFLEIFVPELQVRR